jgi:hypothetical protein
MSAPLSSSVVRPRPSTTKLSASGYSFHASWGSFILWVRSVQKLRAAICLRVLLLRRAPVRAAGLGPQLSVYLRCFCMKVANTSSTTSIATCNFNGSFKKPGRSIPSDASGPSGASDAVAKDFVSWAPRINKIRRSSNVLPGIMRWIAFQLQQCARTGKNYESSAARGQSDNTSLAEESRESCPAVVMYGPLLYGLTCYQ